MTMGTSTSKADTSKVYTIKKGYWKSTWLDSPTSDWSDFRLLLEKWSRIPSDQALEHVIDIRNKAYERYPWPCLGLFSFLKFAVARHPSYDKLLRRLRDENETFLDVGCCFAQDLRGLAADGVPTENLFGADLHPDFIEYGYELFRDKDKMKAKFVTGDILADQGADGTLAEIDGKIDIIEAAYFLHVFSWEDQVKALSRMIRFLKADSKDAMIFGWQTGMRKPGTYVEVEQVDSGVENTAEELARSRKLFKHDPETFKALFEEVAERTGTKWDVKARMRPIPDWLAKDNEILAQHIWFGFEAHRL